MNKVYYCACCGEENETFVDPSGGEVQEYVEDCRVCCRPMVITARWNAVSAGWDIEVYQEDVG